MQPLQPVSIKLVISHLRIRFLKAFSVLADLSAVGNFPHSLGPKITQGVPPISNSVISRSRKI